jgi:NADPH:quinone reductase-like Zn-dependent oxidoreductase
VKDQSVWHKINKDSPMEYAATITVNPLTALKMLEDFITLNSGTGGIFLILVLYPFTCLTLTSLV